MANAPQGKLRFAGIWADGDFTVPRTGSTQPDLIRAQFILGANLPQYGDIEVWYGDNFIRIPKCRLLRQTIQGSTGGRYREVEFLDTRWAWAFIYGFGNANVQKRMFGSWYNLFHKERIEIVREFFQLLDQTPIVVPPDALFEMNPKLWGVLADSDSYHAANHFDGRPLPECIEEVLQPFGVQVHLGWDNQVRLYGNGYGREIPKDVRVMDYTISSTPPMIPEVLAYEFANVNFENDFKLEAVGYLWDKTTNSPSKKLVPLSALNYGPRDPITDEIDWKLADPPLFNNIKDKKQKELCRRTIFKLYRIDPSVRTELVKPSFPTLPPNSNIQVDDSDFIFHDPVRISVPAQTPPVAWKQWGAGREFNRLLFDNEADDDMKIYGWFADMTLHRKNNYSPAANETLPVNEFQRFSDAEMREDAFADRCYNGRFEFDPEMMTVQLDDRLVLINRDAGEVQEGAYRPAELILRARHKLRRHKDFEIIRYIAPVQINSPYVARGIVDKIRIDDPVHVDRFHPQSFDRLVNQLSVLTQQYMASKRMVESATVPMKGFAFDIATDGKISTVTFQRSGGQCSTTVQWQNEDPSVQPTYKELVSSVLRKSQMQQMRVATAKQNFRLNWFTNTK
jgi:hypothetical protein